MPSPKHNQQKMLTHNTTDTASKIPHSNIVLQSQSHLIFCAVSMIFLELTSIFMKSKLVVEYCGATSTHLTPVSPDRLAC